MRTPPPAPVDFAALLRRDPILQRVAHHTAGLPGELFLVGGAPRDLLRGRQPRDHDFIVAATADAARRFLETLAAESRGRLVELGREGAAETRLVVAGRELDFVQVPAEGLAGEIARRDFTLNAIAVHVPSGRVHDPLEGRRDLAAGLLRQAAPGVMDADPLRTLRAVRLLAEEVAGRIEPETAAAIRQAAPRLATCAAERLGVEMDRIMASRHAAGALALMRRWGLLPAVLPVAATLDGVTQNRFHHLDCWRHTLAALVQTDRLPALVATVAAGEDDPLAAPEGEDLLVLKYAVLCHDLGKPATRSVGGDGRVHFYGHEKASLDGVNELAARCRFSRRRVQRIRALVRNHLRPGALGRDASDKALRRLVHAAGDDLDLLILLSLADMAATRGGDFASRHAELAATCRILRRLRGREGDALTAPRPLLNGRAAMRLTGLGPGPQLGRLLAGLVRLQVEGEVTSRRQARAAILRLHRQGGGDPEDGRD